MTRDGIRALQLVVGLAVIVGSGYLVFDRFFSWDAGPQTEIVLDLKRSERAWTPEDGGALPLVAERVRYERIAVQPLGADEAFALATLDFDGRVGERTVVSALGVEWILFRREGRAWRPVKGRAPRLVAVLTALERRRRALHEGDEPALRKLTPHAGALEPLAEVLSLRRRSYSVSAWYIRLERDEAQVTEAYRLEGETPDRPVDQKGSRRLRLVRDGDEFFFSPGLM